ncbi:MAG TPA: TonB-dependent receptor, partial [Vicinamibacterales bacterium]
EGTYGNYDQQKITGVLNVPLADTFKVRAVVERNKRDGYMKNLAGVGPDAYNDLDYTYARLSVVADLTPDLENYTIFHYSDSRTNGYASRITGCATPTSPINPLNTTVGTAGYSGTRHLQATSCGIQLARQTARGDSLYDIETSNANPFLNIKQWQFINTLTYRANDNITLKNITSYGEFHERANFDLGSSNFVVAPVDTGVTLTGQPATGFSLRRISSQLPNVVAPAGTPYQRIVLDVAGPGIDNSGESTFTNEFQIQGNYEKLNFVLGGYLEFSRPLGFSGGRTGIFLNCNRPETIDCTNPLLFGSISESSTKISFDNHGLYGQGTYNFSDQFAVTAGARYTFDKIVGLTQSTRAGFSASAVTGALFTDPVGGKTIARACTDSFRHIADKPGLDRRVCNTTLTNKSNKPTWMIDFDYKPTPDLLFYAKYARGYRQGGLNFTNPGVESWAPEKTDNFEVGAKASFRGAVSGYVNFAAFYNKLANQQIFAQLIPDATNAARGVAGGNAVVNAGKSRIYGAEIDASVLFFDSLRFDAGYTYLNTKIQSASPAATRGDGTPLGDFLVGSPFDRIIPTAKVGSAFTSTPKHKLTVTGTYTLPLDESIGKISFGATWAHSSKSINDAAVPEIVNGIPLGLTPANDIINLNFDWKGVAGSPVDLALFVTNVTKEEFTVASTGAWNSAGVAEILLNQPRFYGVRLR